MSIHWLILDQVKENDAKTETSKTVHPTEEWMKQINDGKYRKKTMNEMMMNFLVTEGYAGAAEKFQIESKTEPALDLASIEDRLAIKKAIHCGNIDFALEIIEELYPEILKKNDELAFRLLQQSVIELIRNRKNEAAIAFSQEQLTPFAIKNEALLEDAGETLAMLVYEDPYESPQADLLKESRREKIANEVNAAILSHQNHETYSRIEWDLKVLSNTQRQLDKVAVYPRVTDFATAKFECPEDDPQTAAPK